MNVDREPIFTIGHSTRPLDQFIALLNSQHIVTLIDVRTVPRSRHNPQFNIDTLPDALAATNIGYTHMPGLGGLRRPAPTSINQGWRNASFRGYADYMQTSQFAENLSMLIARAQRERTVLMCAEAVPWRCHRSLIADALLVQDIPVKDIISEARTQSHALTSFAQVTGKTITYPLQGQSLSLPFDE